jgi:ferredoxin
MPARIVVDRDRCEGLGMCEAMASDYFELTESSDGDDEMVVLREEVADADRGHVHAATQACPVLALTLTG